MVDYNLFFSIFFFYCNILHYITYKNTYYLQCQRNLQFNDNNKTYNTNIIYDFFNNLHYNNILHYNLLTKKAKIKTRQLPRLASWKLRPW